MNEKMKRIVIDDMFLTTDAPTSAGSKMLDGYQSLIDAEAVLRAKEAGYIVHGTSPVGEFAIDLLGETCAHGEWIDNGNFQNASAQQLLEEDVIGALCLDVNGYPRRAAAQAGLVCLKPTYGAISREGVVSVAPSGETVDILAMNLEDCRDLFGSIAKENTAKPSQIRRVAILTTFDDSINDGVKEKISTAISNLKKTGICITYVENSVFCAAKAAWNILLCAELSKSTARFDGVRYGYRTKNFTTLDELYTNSRTEGFGDLVKAAILYGSEVLSAQNYTNVYEKVLRVRRVIADEFAKLFENFDSVLLPACSQMFYTEEQVSKDKYIAFEENRYTAPATLAGLPAIVAGGVQLIGKPNAEEALLDVAKMMVGEGN